VATASRGGSWTRSDLDAALHPTTAAALRAYSRARGETFPQAETEAGTFFVNSLGRPLDRRNTPKTFAELVTAAGIKALPGQRAPRLHDLRHVFTVATLLDWYRDGGDVQARLPVLSTWLGHTDPKSTYWYYSDSRVIPMPAPSCA
jgi:integrase/recombinase XerD